MQYLKKQTLIPLSITVIASSAGFYYLLMEHQEPLAPSAFAALSLGILLFAYLSLIGDDLKTKIKTWLSDQPLRLFTLIAGLLGTYLLFSFGTQSFELGALARISAFACLPAVLLTLANRWSKDVNLLDFLCIACLWLPFDTGFLKNVWRFPAGDAAYILSSIFAVNLAVVLFVAWRGFDKVGFSIQWQKDELKYGAKIFLGFMLFALVFGLATDFIKYNGSVFPPKLFGAFPGILLFIAIPEELLFRGILQNLGTKKFPRHENAVILCIAVAFGLSHLNNGPYPDWRYAFLATIAGIAYGFAYKRTRNLTVPALIHAGVDAVWICYFM